MRGALPEHESPESQQAPAHSETRVARSLVTREPGPGPRPERRPIPPSLRARYEDLRFLGQGGMGTVYRGRDPRLGREVAVKLLQSDDPELWHRFLREARAQARVQHENVCRVYEAGEADGEPFIAMQLVEGEPLGRGSAPMTLEQKVKALREVCAAVHEAHRLGLIHRDIKPGNILVERREDGSYKPYILDFGLAREVAEQGQTVTGAAVGTPAYMAPEQARGQVRALDRRTDVYSLGATLYELFVGRPPFVADHPWRVLMKVVTEDPPPLGSLQKGIPPELEIIVMKCLERDPSRRYDSARALGEDLQRFLDGEPIRARRASLPYVLWKKAKKHKLATALAAMTLLSAIVLLASRAKARRDAQAQALLAEEFGKDVTEMEFFLRSAYQLPLHDVERERAVVRGKLRDIERRIAEAGALGEGPGYFALGRGYLALEEPAKAREHLLRAKASGYASPALDFALGLSLEQLYGEALGEAEKIEDDAERKARLADVKVHYRDEGLALLRAALPAQLESPAYAEGVVATYEGRYADALEKARKASATAPWLFEAKVLEGQALHSLAGDDWITSAPDWWEKMQGHVAAAEKALDEATDMARSDPRAYLWACAFWARAMYASNYRGVARRPRFEKGKVACTRAVQVDSASREARRERANLHVLYAYALASRPMPEEDPREEIPEAIELAEEVVREHPTLEGGHQHLGTALRAAIIDRVVRGLDARALVRAAKDAYEAALQVNPNDSAARMDLARVHEFEARQALWRGEDLAPIVEGAEKLIERDLAKSSPTNTDAHDLRATLGLVVATQRLEGGQSPEGALALVLAASRKGAELTPSWQEFPLYRALAHRIAAEHALATGADPRGALAEAAREIEALARLDGYGTDTARARGLVAWTEARVLLGERRDPTPALDTARRDLRRVAEAAPWNVGAAVSQARVEIVAVRWTVAQGTPSEATFESALALLRTFLAEERDDPGVYEALAEVFALRAAWHGARKGDGDVAEGLAMAEKALAKNPRMADALATRGRLFLLRARGEKEGRAEDARRAGEAFEAATRQNPLLRGELEPLIEEARRLP